MITLEKNHPATNQAAQQVWQHRLRRSGYFIGAVLLHLILFLLIATWVVFQAPKPPTDANFGQVKSMPVKLPPPPQPPSSSDAANNPQLEPQTVVVPVVTPPSVITTVNNNFTVDSHKLLDQALSHVTLPPPEGTGMSPGASGGGGSSGTGSIYGSTTGNGQELLGYLYDLKQTPDKQQTDMADSNPSGAKNGLSFLRSWVKDWDMGALNKYYKAPAPLYATQIFIPLRKSDESTKAFGVDGVVQAKRWIIIYDAKVMPPETGTFRFVGWADDFMMVRCNGDNVMDASYQGEELDPTATAELAGNGPEALPFKFGKWIQMQEGVAVSIQILIGEGPGGDSGFLLMVQKQGDNSKPGDDPVFQLMDGPIPDLGKGFSKKKMLFQPAAQ